MGSGPNMLPVNRFCFDFIYDFRKGPNMITNRTTQLIYQSFYCALGLVGIVASFGIFDDYTMFRWDFYVHFTNLSNYFCVGIMVAQLVQTAKKKEDSYVTTAPLLKFIGVLAILLTFVVFNTMLAGAAGRDPGVR